MHVFAEQRRRTTASTSTPTAADRGRRGVRDRGVPQRDVPQRPHRQRHRREGRAARRLGQDRLAGRGDRQRRVPRRRPGRPRGAQRVHLLAVTGPDHAQLDVPQLRDDGPDDHARRLVGPAHLRRRDAREQRLRALRQRQRPATGTTTACCCTATWASSTDVRIVNNTFETPVGGITTEDIVERERRVGQQHRRRLGLPAGHDVRAATSARSAPRATSPSARRSRAPRRPARRRARCRSAGSTRRTSTSTSRPARPRSTPAPGARAADRPRRLGARRQSRRGRLRVRRRAPAPRRHRPAPASDRRPRAAPRIGVRRAAAPAQHLPARAPRLPGGA